MRIVVKAAHRHGMLVLTDVDGGRRRELQERIHQDCTNWAWTLEADHPVVFSMGVGGIHRCSKAAVFADEIFLGDPTGPATESSNRDPDFPSDQKGHQVLKGRNAYAMYLLRDVVFDQRGGLPHQDDASLMAGINGPLGHQEGESCRSRVVRAVGANVKNFCHNTPPYSLADISQIKLTFLDIAPSGILRTIIPHSNDVNRPPTRCITPSSGAATTPTGVRSQNRPLPTQVDPLGSPFVQDHPVIRSPLPTLPMWAILEPGEAGQSVPVSRPASPGSPAPQQAETPVFCHGAPVVRPS